MVKILQGSNHAVR